MKHLFVRTKKAIRYFFTDWNPLLDKFVATFCKKLPDELYLKLRYRFIHGYWPNLENPKTFCEKLQWLKLNDRNPLHTIMVDKYEVKEYVSGIIGSKYVIPTFGVWDKFEDIEFDKLPNQFVLKVTHDSGGVVICRDKQQFNKKEAEKKISSSLNSDFYSYSKEWPYKNVPRRIIAEQYLEDKEHPGNLVDYKFFCFNGIVKFFKVDFDRFIDHHANYYSLDGKLLYFGEADYPPIPDRKISIPENLGDMIYLAERLSKGHVFLRVDFYSINSIIYFGELTFYPASGLSRFTPISTDIQLGELLDIKTQGE